MFVPDSRKRCCSWVVLLAGLSFLFGPLPGYTAISSIPPQILSELRSLSPAEQVELAEKYGFQIPTLNQRDGAGDGKDPVGAPGENLEVFERVKLLELETEKESVQILKTYKKFSRKRGSRKRKVSNGLEQIYLIKT